MTPNYSGLEEFIIDSGIISRSIFDAYYEESKASGVPIDVILVNRGVLGEDEMRKAWAHVIGVPFTHVDVTSVDTGVFTALPEPMSRAHNAVVINKEGPVIEVALLDMREFGVIREYCDERHIVAKPRLVKRDTLNGLLRSYQAHMKEEYGKKITESISKMETDKELQQTPSLKALYKISEHSGLAELFGTLLEHAHIQGAHDIHFDKEEKQFRIRYRIGMHLYDAISLPRHLADALFAHIKYIGGFNLEEEVVPQEKKTHINIRGNEMLVRMATLPTHKGEKITLHITPEYSNGFTLEALGFVGRTVETIQSALRKPGLVVVGGPVGSGKTTTLYTMLDMLNRPDKAVFTIEDSVGFVLSGVSQIETNEEKGLTMSSGLRAILKQDPDVIMIGEIRDRKTLELALSAASRGVTVLAGMYGDSVADILVQMRHTGVDSHSLASNLSLVIASRLVDKLNDPKKRRYLKKAEIISLEARINAPSLMRRLRSEGVIGEKDTFESIPFYFTGNKDVEAGYSGKVGIHEVVPITGSIRDAIISRMSSENLSSCVESEYPYGFREDGVFKAIQGLTSLNKLPF